MAGGGPAGLPDDDGQRCGGEAVVQPQEWPRPAGRPASMPAHQRTPTIATARMAPSELHAVHRMGIHIHTHMCTYIHIHMYIHMYAHMYIYVDMCTYVHTYTYAHIYVHTYIHLYVYMCRTPKYAQNMRSAYSPPPPMSCMPIQARPGKLVKSYAFGITEEETRQL